MWKFFPQWLMFFRRKKTLERIKAAEDAKIAREKQEEAERRKRWDDFIHTPTGQAHLQSMAGMRDTPKPPRYAGIGQTPRRYREEYQRPARDDSNDLLNPLNFMSPLSPIGPLSIYHTPAPSPSYECPSPSPSYEAPAPSPSYDSSSSCSSSSYDSSSSSSSSGDW